MYRNFQHRHHKTNKLSRSNTRIALLEYCEKKYFLNYYTFSLKKIDQKLRETGIINKKIKTLEMWIGEKTHFLISDYLNLIKNKEDTNENINKIKEGLAEEMRYDFENSKNKNYNEPAFWEREWLCEHYYWENIDDKLEETIQKVRNNLDNFIKSPWIVKIKDYIDLKYPVYIENPKNPDFESMRVDTRWIPELKDISIMASPDFWIKFSNNKYLILDWKTGKEPEMSLWIPEQLKVYALKTLLKKNRTPELWDVEIETHELYLPSTNTYGGKIQQEDLDDIVKLIIQDVNFQKTFLVDQDPYKNQPISSTSFSRTQDEEKCKTCPFRKVCEELKAFE